MGFDYVVLESKDAISTLTLNRPDKLNALNRPFIAEVGQALQEVANDSGSRILIMKGQGKAFCVGDDLNEDFSDVKTSESAINVIERLQRVTELIASMRKLVIAVVHGHAIGAGLEWMMNCDIKIAADGTTFAMPETRWGYSVTNAGTALLPLHVGMARAKEMVLLNRKIDAQLALEWGLVNKVVPLEKLESSSLECAQTLLRNKQTALVIAKRALNSNYCAGLGEVIANEARDAAICGMDLTVAEDAKDAFNARKP